MKQYLIITLIVLCTNNARAQNNDSISAITNAATKLLTWEIQKGQRGDIMFLNIPYQRDNQDSIQYLTLAVAKDYSQKRPAFISIIVPDDIVQGNGIFVKFAKDEKTNEKPGWKIELEKGNPVRAPFESCDSLQHTCTARIIDGYITDPETNEQVDIFQKFFDFDHVLFLVVYADGGHKSIDVPLFTFKHQYETL